MGRILGAALFAWGPCGLGQGRDATPTELLEARAHYEEAMREAARPIRERYIEELEQLETTAYYTKDFDLAKAAGREIESMGGAGLSATDWMVSPEEFIRKRLVNTTWVWGRGETITFLADGGVRWSGKGAGRWKVASATPPVVEGVEGNGDKFRIVLDPGLREGRVFEGMLAQRGTSEIDFRF
jgi:hypothetical protein